MANTGESAMKSLHVKLPPEHLATLQEVAKEKTLSPATYARTVLVGHLATQQKRRKRGRVSS